jgi:hypothetical protein
MENSGAVFLSGFLSSSASVAGSIASASAAKVSMMMLIHRRCTVVRTDSSSSKAATVTKVMITVVMFVDSWNCKNLHMASFMQHPHIIALTIEQKLSSIRMISEASFATSVPAIPIEKPTLEVFSAGPSLVLSPVTPTTSQRDLRVSTRISLSPRDKWVRTWSRGNDLNHLLVKFPKHWTFHNDTARCKDTALGRDGFGSENIVASVYLDGHTSLITICNSSADAVTERVFDASDADQGKVLGKIVGWYLIITNEEA